jgi:hypothetical protein
MADLFIKRSTDRQWGRMHLAQRIARHYFIQLMGNLYLVEQISTKIVYSLD